MSIGRRSRSPAPKRSEAIGERFDFFQLKFCPSTVLVVFFLAVIASTIAAAMKNNDEEPIGPVPPPNFHTGLRGLTG